MYTSSVRKKRNYFLASPIGIKTCKNWLQKILAFILLLQQCNAESNERHFIGKSLYGLYAIIFYNHCTSVTVIIEQVENMIRISYLFLAYKSYINKSFHLTIYTQE